MEENQNQEQNQEQQEQVETVAKSDYDNIVAELEEVKGKLPKELTDEEKAFQEKQQGLWQKEVGLTLKENGLEQFASLLKVEDEEQLNETVEALNKIVNDIKVSTGYVPEDHQKEDEYSKYEKNNDVSGMIGTKLSKLFK